MTRPIAAMAVMLFASSALIAQDVAAIKSQNELERVLAQLDRELFDAYNRCDLGKFATFFSANVEFFHDQGGVTLGEQNLTESVRKNICGGDVQRELVPGTLEAHLMKGFGALQIGVHRFHHPKSKTPPGQARFIHLWQYSDGAWKILRAISFDHRPVK